MRREHAGLELGTFGRIDLVGHLRFAGGVEAAVDRGAEIFGGTAVEGFGLAQTGEDDPRGGEAGGREDFQDLAGLAGELADLEAPGEGAAGGLVGLLGGSGQNRAVERADDPGARANGMRRGK